MDLQPHTHTLLERCDILAGCSDLPGQVHRLFLTPATHTVHQHLTEWMQQAGLMVHLDPLGNLHGIRRSTNPDARTLLIGSHIDTVPNAGKYDGLLGVLMGIALADQLQTEPLSHHLQVVAFSEEEGVRFQQPFLGSSALTGRFHPDWLNRTDAAGVALHEALTQYGLNPMEIFGAALDPATLLGYLEVHIEQGPVLADANQPIGVVMGIVGQSRLNLTFLGQAGHAGTTPMALRKDALVGAAELVQEVERYALHREGLVATVGRLEVLPNTSNVIPEQVALSLDVRHLSDDVRSSATEDILHFAHTIAEKRGLGLKLEFPVDQAAVPCDPHLTGELQKACQALGLAGLELASGAGHDAMVMASLTPVGMLFVRSPNGISHNPLETVLPEDVEIALQVMKHTLLALMR